MIDAFNSLINFLMKLLENDGFIIGFLVMVLKSFIPCIPIVIFIPLNIKVFGVFLGFIISYLGLVTGSYIMFLLSYKFSDFLDKKLKKIKKLNKIKKSIKNLSYPNLVLLLAIPFSPAFIINIACGICKVDKKKYLISLLVGKITIIYFWGFVGKNLISSVTDITVFSQIIFMIGITYLVSKLVNNFFNK